MLSLIEIIVYFTLWKNIKSDWHIFYKTRAIHYIFLRINFWNIKKLKMQDVRFYVSQCKLSTALTINDVDIKII